MLRLVVTSLFAIRCLELETLRTPSLAKLLNLAEEGISVLLSFVKIIAEVPLRRMRQLIERHCNHLPLHDFRYLFALIEIRSLLHVASLQAFALVDEICFLLDCLTFLILIFL